MIWPSLHLSRVTVERVLPWRRTAASRTPAAHQRGMYLALGAWAATDAAVLLAWLL